MKKPTIDQMTAELLAKGKGKFLQESAEKRRMYHGSRHYPPGKMFHPEHRPSGEGIKEFKNGLRGMTFVSPDPKFSDLYARDAKDSDFMSGAVYPVHVQVRKPFDFENADHLDVMTDELSKLSGKSPQIPAWINGGSEKIRKQLRSGNWDVIEDPLVIDIAKRLGFDGAYMNEQGVKNLGVFDPKRIKSAVGNRGTYDINDPDITKAKGGRVKEPKNTVKAYKLFRVHEKHPGKLFPLFVDANTPVEMGQWIDAKIGEMAGSKVKSKIGPLAFRPGWHAGDTPVATHIGEKSDPSLTAPDRRPANHVWAEVEMPHDVDWQSVANERGMNAQGKIVPVKAHITDQIPVGGHYRYKTNPNMTGDWLIGGSMRVNKVLTDKEVEKINKAAGLSDLPRAQPMKKKTFGFASGGEVGPDEWKAEAHVNHRPKISRMAGGGSQGFPLRVPADDPSMLSELKDSFNRESKTYGNKGAVMDILNRGPVTDYLGSAADLPNMALQGIDYLQSKIPALSEPESVMDADGKRVPKFPLSSDKPWGGKEAWNEALKKLGVTSDVERPIAETTASLLSPLAPFAAKKAITAAKKLAPTVAEMATELAEKGGAPLRQFAVPNEGKLSKEEYSRMMREKYAAENAAKAAKKEAAPVVQEVKAPADNLGFYSGVEKAALNLQRKAGTGDDFIADLMKNPGVNDARISEMGLDALRGKANVTADEVRQLATKNKPQLSESVRVEPSQTKIAELESEYDDLTRELHDLQGSGNSRAISRVESELERNRLEQRYIKDETPADFGPESKPDYNTPGGRNYREIRVKTPAFTPAMEKRAEEIRNTDLRGWTVKKLTPKPGQVYQNPVQILDTGGNSRGTLDGKFTDEEFLQQYAKNAAERELRDTEVFRENIHHGDEKNVLFHLRVADHTDAQGKKGLLIDELQSDWHQQGKKKGYGPQYQDRYRAYYDTEQGPVDIAFGKTPEQLERMIKASGWDAEPIKIRIEKTADKVSQGVPDAPFKENWYQLGLKRAIKEAADKGMDRVYLTTGKTQNERYALSKQISEVHYTDQNGLYAYDKDGQLVIHEKVSKEKLPDYIGKEASEKLINQPAVGGNKVLDGIDLDVGGEGMKHWYDNQYINYLKKYANEHGSTVGMTRLPAANATKNDLSLNQIDKFLKDPEFAKVLDEEFIKRTGAPRITGKIEPQEGGTYMVQWSDGTFSGGYSQKGAFNKMREGKNKAIDDLRSWNAALARSGGQEVYYLELTPKLKNSAKKGQQYKAGGIVRKAIGGITQGNNMQAPTLAQMRMQLNQRKNPDYIDTIGIEQAVDMDPKRYISPNPMQNNFMPVGGVADSNGLPVGGIDQDNAQQGQQFMAPQPQQQDQDMQPNPSPEGTPPPEQEGTPEQKMGNMLSLTPQGQAMQAMGGAPGQPPRMAAGGKVNPLAKIRAEMKYAKGGSHYPPAPALKQSEIEEMAERIARQTTGLENANEVSQQQTEREKNLPVGITSKKKKHVPIINFEEYKGASTVGVPGDPSRGGVVPSKRKLSSPKAGEYLNSIGGEKLEHSVPMYGGKDYGAYGHDDAWASDLGASAGLFNVVKRLAEENPGTDILGHYHKMTPKSLNHAVHMLDAVLSHHKPHKLHPEQITVLNHLMREVATTKGKHDIPYPEFPGFENPAAVMMHGAYNSGMRKKLIGLLGTEKYFPGGKQKMHDIMYALSHPELRNVETGAGGSSILQFDPSRELKDSISPHPTYDYDIPSKLIGRTRYTTPAKIIAPRSMHNAEREIKAMGKKVVPFNQAKLNIIREPIDEQYINQLGAYEQAMKKRLGYKKGGKVSEKTQKDIMKFNVLSKKAK